MSVQFPDVGNKPAYVHSIGSDVGRRNYPDRQARPVSARGRRPRPAAPRLSEINPTPSGEFANACRSSSGGDCTCECVAIEVDTLIAGVRVRAVLQRLAETRGLPASITVDHGPEFDGQVLDAWAYSSNARLSLGDLTPEEYADQSIAERSEALSLTADSNSERD